MFEGLFGKKEAVEHERAQGFKGENGKWYTEGSTVFVRRSPESGGKVEAGWKIKSMDVDAGSVMVEKGDLEKPLSLSEVEDIQNEVSALTQPQMMVSLDMEEIPEGERDNWEVWKMEGNNIIVTRKGAGGVPHTRTIHIDDYLKAASAGAK